MVPLEGTNIHVILTYCDRQRKEINGEEKKYVINRTGTENMRRNMCYLEMSHAEAHETDANKKNVKRNK